MKPNLTSSKDIKATKKTTKKSDISTRTLFKSSLVYQTKEFFNNSTLHGVRYIAETGRPFGEKLMWFCFTTIGAVAALIIIFSLWEKFQTNPTITGLDTDFHNQDVVFPIVAVCPAKAYDDAKVTDYAFNVLSGYDDDAVRFEPFLRALGDLSYDGFGDLFDVTLNLTQDWSTLKSNTLRKYVFEVAVDCSSIFESCEYKDEDISCCKQFLPVFMEHGLCFVFNARYKESADLIEKNSAINDLFETDKKWGLTMKLKAKSDVFIHSHDEAPGWDFRPQFTWDIDDNIEVLISMKQTYTTDDALQLSIGQRKCIFPNEVPLKYYSDSYTFSGCMRDCRIGKSIRYCRCVPPFYAPSSAYKFCTVSDLRCLRDYSKNITNIRGCQTCELSCHNTVYDIEKLNKISLTTTLEKTEAVISIDYLTWPIVRYKREVLFGWVDLLVSFGGIAGLFLGFSLLSGVEIIYYFTMRAFCMLYKNRDELYSIEYDKQQKPPRRYDLSLRPHLKRRRIRSPSGPSVITVKTTVPNKLTPEKIPVATKEATMKGSTTHLTHSILSQNTAHKNYYEKQKYLKPNFKLGNVNPLDVYLKRGYRGAAVDSYSYMP